MAFFDRTNVRGWLSLAWVVAFSLLFMSFSFLLAQAAQSIENNLSQLEENISQQEWQAASESIRELESNWQKQSILVQINNGTTNVSTFEQLLAEAEIQIMNEEPGALQSIGSMRQVTKDITSAFPGP